MVPNQQSKSENHWINKTKIQFLLIFELLPSFIFNLLFIFCSNRATVNIFYQKKMTDIFNKFAFANRKLILIIIPETCDVYFKL